MRKLEKSVELISLILQNEAGQMMWGVEAMMGSPFLLSYVAGGVVRSFPTDLLILLAVLATGWFLVPLAMDC